MKSFEELVEKLSVSPEKVVVLGKERKIKGMARYTSKNLAPDEYIKVEFDDHSLVVVVLADKQVFFTDRAIGKLEGVEDEKIGVEEVDYEGKKFRLDNKDDYQYCLQVYAGKPGRDIEGEGKFFDYIFEGESGLEVLSLGWQSNTGKRADVWVGEIGLEEIEIMG